MRLLSTETGLRAWNRRARLGQGYGLSSQSLCGRGWSTQLLEQKSRVRLGIWPLITVVWGGVGGGGGGQRWTGDILYSSWNRRARLGQGYGLSSRWVSDSGWPAEHGYKYKEKSMKTMLWSWGRSLSIRVVLQTGLSHTYKGILDMNKNHGWFLIRQETMLLLFIIINNYNR